MSHELRTPLNSIIGFSGILLQGFTGRLSEEQRKQVAMIRNSGEHLLELVNQVLDLTKIESSQENPRVGVIDVARVARVAFDAVGPMASAKRIEMRWACAEDLAPIHTDELRVGQILLNLMGNAVKFTERGWVAMTVSREGSGVMIAVQDTGCGVASKHVEDIFTDFFQVVPLDGAKSEGTGLGLGLSRRLADSIGARIEVTSELGRGSVFTLHIPGSIT
jgi:signal transduction histidine kinase